VSGEDVYRGLCETMGRRGGRYPGRDIPEFYEMARVLFTEEEAAVSNAMTRGFQPAGVIAEAMGRTEQEVAPILESMAVPGIFEFQFLRGTSTERDRQLARLIHAYKEALDAGEGPPRIAFPGERVIPVDRVIKAENTVRTYHQVASYIERYEPLAVGTCFCRHQARLIDEKDHCGSPDDVCMQFGEGARFVIDRGMGRQITKEEAMETLRKSEEAGLVHATLNRQEIDFLCNCCSCHCVILKTALSQPKPGLALNSGFMPVWDPLLCTACGVCVERCPTSAVTLGDADVPQVNPDRCIGCGVCATGCPERAIGLDERPDIPAPPVDQKALKEAIRASRT
jgi:ferredoxin